MKFYENPSGGGRVVQCEQTDRYDEVIVAFHNFVNAPKNGEMKITTYRGIGLIDNIKHRRYSRHKRRF
jgi:hypothetical protein